MPLDTTGRLLRELKGIDEREDETLAALLEHATRLEELELRDRRVTVADLQQLKAALDHTLAKIAKAQAAAIAPAAVTVRPATNGGTSAGDPSPAVSTAVQEPVIRPEPLPAPPATVSELAKQLNDNEAASDRLREQLAQRLHALAPIAERVAAERAEAAGESTAGRVRTFRLQPSLMKGGDVQAFQRVINQRFAGLRIGRRIAENGVYGPNTRKAAHQVAFCLGLITTDLEDGITPAVRVVLRTPSRRSERQKQRARAGVPRVSREAAATRGRPAHDPTGRWAPAARPRGVSRRRSGHLAYKQQRGPRGKGGMVLARAN